MPLLTHIVRRGRRPSRKWPPLRRTTSRRLRSPRHRRNWLRLAQIQRRRKPQMRRVRLLAVALLTSNFKRHTSNFRRRRLTASLRTTRDARRGPRLNRFTLHASRFTGNRAKRSQTRDGNLELGVRSAERIVRKETESRRAAGSSLCRLGSAGRDSAGNSSFLALIPGLKVHLSTKTQADISHR